MRGIRYNIVHDAAGVAAARRYAREQALRYMQVVAMSTPKAYRFAKKRKLTPKMETLPPTHCAAARLLGVYYLHIFHFPKFGRC